MAKYKCRDCIHADVCEEAETLIGFSRDNPAYCGMFLNAAELAPVRHGRWIMPLLMEDGHIHAECSHCHKIRIIDDYCSACGAIMDLEDTED